MVIKQQYEKITNGCKCDFFNYKKFQIINFGTTLETFAPQIVPTDMEYVKCNKEHLCPSCSAKKEVFLERCRDELNFYEKNYNLKLASEFNSPMATRILQLKEVLNSEQEVHREKRGTFLEKRK